MPCKRQSDDADHVTIDPKSSKPSKDPPPPQWPLPDFAPLAIENELTYGQTYLMASVQMILTVYFLYFSTIILLVFV